MPLSTLFSLFFCILCSYSLLAQRSITILNPMVTQSGEAIKEEIDILTYIHKSTKAIHLSLTYSQTSGYKYINNFSDFKTLKKADLELRCRLISGDFPILLEIELYQFDTKNAVYPYHTAIQINDLAFDEQDKQQLKRALDIWLYAWFRIENLSKDFHRALYNFEKEANLYTLEKLTLKFKAYADLANDYYTGYDMPTSNILPEHIFKKPLAIGHDFIIAIQVAILKSNEEYKDLKQQNLNGVDNLSQMIAVQLNNLNFNKDLFGVTGSRESVQNMIAACEILTKLYEEQGNVEKMGEMNGKRQVWEYVLEKIKP